MPAGEGKSVKKEEVEDEGDELSLSSFVKDKKKKSVNGSAEARVKIAKVKKEEPKDEDSDEPTPKKTPKKVDKLKEKKKKKKKKDELEKKVVAAEDNGKKREKKVFDLPGQKRDPPEERDPLRIFYETLYQQLPGSDMAAFWMMENGLLPKDVAKKVYEKKQKKNQQQKLSSPIKVVTSVNRTTKSVTVKRTTSSPASSVKKTSSASSVKKTSESKTVLKQSKKRNINSSSESESSDADDDDDFVLVKKKTKKLRA